MRVADDVAEHAIVRCDCYRYPVIDGILVLKQQSGPADIHDARVQHLEAGDYSNALAAALGTEEKAHAREGLVHSLLQRVRRYVGQHLDTTAPENADLARSQSKETNLQAMLHRTRPGLYADYLYHRYANNSFHASIPILLLLNDLTSNQDAPRVLELTCGIGHSAFLIRSIFPHLDVVATDHDYLNLWIAKHFFATNAELLCIDAEMPLPFKSGSFSGVFCLDGFHYVRSKISLGKEIARVGRSDALFLFPHLHNRLQHNVHAGIPLAPDGYKRCFDTLPSVVFDETTVLRNFVSHGQLRLDEPEDAPTIAQAQSIALVATRRPGFWHAREDLTSLLCADPTQLLPNPLYALTAGNEYIDLTAKWPNAALEAECQPTKTYLPQSARIDSKVIDRLIGTSCDAACDETIKRLVQSFALVRLPKRAYGSNWQTALSLIGART